MSDIVFREDGTILVKDVRLSYAHLFTPWGTKEDKKAYSGKFLIPKDRLAAVITPLAQYINKLSMEKFKVKLASDRVFLRNGDDIGKVEAEGHFVISASDSKNRPAVIDRNRSPIVEADDKVYSGCWVNVLIRPWVQDSKEWGKRINANLLAVQFVRDDDRFAGTDRPDVNEVFGDVSSDFGDDSGGGDDADPFAS